MSVSMPQGSAMPGEQPAAAPKQVVNPRKARRTGWILSLAAFIMALAAGTMATRYLNQMEAEIGTTQQIVVAARVIPAGSLVTPDMLGMKELPVKYLAPTYLLSVRDIADGQTTTKIDISPGEFIQQNMVTKNSGLDQGMVPITIGVNQKTSAGNSVRQGNFVDILVSYKDDDGKPTTKYLLQRVKVLAVDNLLPAQGGSGSETYLPAGSSGQVRIRPTRFVTLEATKEQAAQITYAENFANELRLVIRRFDDTETPNVDPVHFIGTDDAFRGGSDQDAMNAPDDMMQADAAEPSDDGAAADTIDDATEKPER